MAARPFTVAASHGITRVRVFEGDDLVIQAWQRDPVTTFARIQQLLDDAAAAHVKITISNYLTQETVAALAGHPYSSWAAAQRDLTTPGSAPWNELTAWLQSVTGRFGSNHAAASFEVMNEPNYMLGLDSQAVDRDQGVRFLDYFADVLHSFGAAQVNGGGRPVFDPMTLTDAQLALYVRHLDVLDDHLYPALGAGHAGRHRHGCACRSGGCCSLVHPRPAHQRQEPYARHARRGRQHPRRLGQGSRGCRLRPRLHHARLGVRRLRREQLHRYSQARRAGLAVRAVRARSCSPNVGVSPSHRDDQSEHEEVPRDQPCGSCGP